MAMARDDLPKDLRETIDDMLSQRTEWWVPGKIGEIRQQLSPVWRACPQGSSQRNLLMLDIALESFLHTRMTELNASVDGMSGTLLSSSIAPISTLQCGPYLVTFAVMLPVAMRTRSL